MATLDFSDETYKGLLTELALRELHRSNNQFMAMFRPPVRYPHIDKRGCWRGRERKWFEILTPMGRLKMLNHRARRLREGWVEIKIVPLAIRSTDVHI